MVVAVVFGGPSTEHDVSVLTGLQILDAIDSSRYDTLPVYVTLEGHWYVGDALRNRKNYIPDEAVRRTLDRVFLPIGGTPEEAADGRWRLVSSAPRSLLGRKSRTYPFDLVVPAFHGTFGEDGSFQGLLNAAGVPYVGCDVLPAALAMNKAVAKAVIRSVGVPVVPAVAVPRPAGSGFASLAELAARVDIPFPVCVKPCNLGSSVGVSQAGDRTELEAALSTVFKFDTAALVETFVRNLVEYNVSVTRAFGETRVSAIERPIRKEKLLDFRDKYLSGGDADSKIAIPFSEGMASATRVINPPELTPDQQERIRNWAMRAFEALDARGTARIDFLSDAETGEIWLNEVNTLPGSFGYYLWENADPPVSFTALLNALMDEAVETARQRSRVVDPVQANASVFKRG
jgi:D-alanine-D-alanine ligase